MSSRRLLALAFLPAAPLCLFLLLLGAIWRLRVVYLQPSLPEGQAAVISSEAGVTPAQSHTGIKTAIEEGDARVAIVAAFLERHNSPLDPADHYARALVEAADRYNLDYRLLPAIMMQESNLCKSAPAGTNNCLGFGIHKRGTLGFDTYEASFDRAARELKERYVDIGLTTPEQIMTKYTPSSNGSWAFSVNQWIVEMEYNDREKARVDRQDNNLLEYTKEE
jgi:hypothetical protein